jgi:AcrR family transcriptional regulator
MAEEKGVAPGGDERRRQPKQTRSMETRNSILEAAASLFDEKGYEQTTTHQIATRANVSVGALYRYFADKQAILTEVYARETIALRDRILGEFSFVDLLGKDLRALLRKAIEAVFQVYTDRPGLRRTLSEQARKIGALAEMRRSQEQEIHRALRQLLSSPGVRVPDVDVAAYLIALFVESLADDYVLYRSKDGSLDPERVVESMVDLLLRFALDK